MRDSLLQLTIVWPSLLLRLMGLMLSSQYELVYCVLNPELLQLVIPPRHGLQ